EVVEREQAGDQGDRDFPDEGGGGRHRHPVGGDRARFPRLASPPDEGAPRKALSMREGAHGPGDIFRGQIPRRPPPLHRRRLLLAALSLPAATLLRGRAALAGAHGPTGAGAPGGAFDERTVPALAAALAANAYRPPARRLPAELADMGYDRYRDYR